MTAPDSYGEEETEPTNVLSPIGPADIELRQLAARSSSLTGRRIGVLDNTKPYADVLLGRVAERLVERAGAGSVRRWRNLAPRFPRPT